MFNPGDLVRIKAFRVINDQYKVTNSEELIGTIIQIPPYHDGCGWWMEVPVMVKDIKFSSMPFPHTNWKFQPEDLELVFGL